MVRLSSLKYACLIASQSHRGSLSKTVCQDAARRFSLYAPKGGISNASKERGLPLNSFGLGFFRRGSVEKSFLSMLIYQNFHSSASRFMAAKDYYEVLGIRKGAPASEIKKAYYALAKQNHPDVNKGDPEAEKKFQEIQKAYEVLKDDEKRSIYDQVGREAYEQQAAGGAPGGPGGPGFGGFGGFEDIFNGGINEALKNMFKQRSYGGQDVKIQLELSFMEAVQGCTKNLAIQADVCCSSCKGTGMPPGVKPQTCKSCKGSGSVGVQSGFFMFESTCRHCGGSGKTVKELCKTCQGKRVVRGSKNVAINLMPGVNNDETIRMTGQGGDDPDGVQPGDLYILLKVREDPIFRREGSDIYVDAVISFTQAILGGTIQVPTLNGDVVLKVREGTQPGQKVVLKGKGIKMRYGYGNQYVIFKVTIPTHLTQRQRALIEEFAKEEGNEDLKSAAGASG